MGNHDSYSDSLCHSPLTFILPPEGARSEGHMRDNTSCAGGTPMGMKVGRLFLSF